jgi:tRNA A-37 threonylcarbamoyl transferase component Bud32
MKHTEFIKLLKYFDGILWDRKTIDGWNYNGLILDAFFDMSILSIDYLNIYDYFSSNGVFSFVETEFLENQYLDVNEDKRIKVIENILNVYKYSTYDKNQSEMVLSKVIKFLDRNGVIINNSSNGPIQLSDDDIIDEGSYCYIKKYKKGILKKELRPIYQSNLNFQKRMRYEYENMQKLKDCPQVLNVYSYNTEDNSYLMEEADVNLFDYLNKEVDIKFEQKMKIILDVLNGMKYAHEQSIIHRDLHLGNILKYCNDFVLSDFGSSKDESIERSLKSSATEKNNHSFLDPLGVGDFAKLDKKSDIYSLGKVIDYVFTVNTANAEHIFTFIVEKCTSRNKEKRYESVDEIINDIVLKIKEQDSNIDKHIVLEKIQNNNLDVQVIEYIDNLVKGDKLCDYLVKNNSLSFGGIIIKYQDLDQIRILQSINRGFVESTGYGGFRNYDIFADIAYYICLNTDEKKVYSLAYDILEGCSQYRFTAKRYLEGLDKRNL